MDDTDTSQPTQLNSDEEKIRELETKILELESNWKRALADYKNLEKRVTEEKEAVVAFSNLILISRLLSVLDNLENLENHLDDVGLKLTIKEFGQILKDEGLKDVAALGRDFDSGIMEAVETVEGEENKVVAVLRKGYMLKDKLIRPARVRVGKKGKI